MQQQCSHFDQIRDVELSAQGCEECLQMGDTWVHLRECLFCGHVGCCVSSPNRHATKHFQATEHPIVQSFQPGEDWRTRGAESNGGSEAVASCLPSPGTRSLLSFRE